MVYGDRSYNQEAIAHLNSTSPLNFTTEDISAEDLARDLDLFTNTQFFDFDFGDPSPFTSDSTGGKQSDRESREGNAAHLNVPADTDITNNFTFFPETVSYDLNAVSDEDSADTKRRKLESSVVPEDTSLEPLDENARAAAEEDKRRRNTLASARFRAKKKMREQALEKDAKEMTAKIEKMEGRIKELELENKWLRGLVVQNKP